MKQSDPGPAEGRKKTGGTGTRAKQAGPRARKTQTGGGPASRKKKEPAKPQALNIIPIGGLHEIGKNLTVLEYGGKMLLIDCGMSFPEDGMLGIDVVIPDFTFLIKNAPKIEGLIVTNGHEDHIGAVPYLLKKVNVPVYGTRITLGLIENKLKEHGLTGDLRAIAAGDKLRIGPFDIDVIHTTHSVADALCFYIRTPGATLFHSGDFKVDYTPIDGDPIDLAKIAEVGASGVDVMLCDSTNATRPGFTRSERFVGETLDRIFPNAKGRIIIATFSSNVHRVQTIIDLTKKYGRKFSVSGRSMEKVVAIAQELGYLKVPRGLFVPLDKSGGIEDDKIVIITTGSQGEPMSALARMAGSEHKDVKLKKGDTVILSSTPVPGNEKSVSNVVNKLYDKGVDVIYNEILDIHVSGHACQEELKLIHSLIRPKFFMPVHGESRHLAEHGKLAESLGMPKGNIFQLRNGDMLSVTHEEASVMRHVASADDIMVDGLGVGDVGSIVLNDRKILSTGGLMLVVFVMDPSTGQIISGPEITTKGFVLATENEDLIKKAEEAALEAVRSRTSGGECDLQDIKNGVRSALRKFIMRETHRAPMIIPVIMEVKAQRGNKR